MAPFQTASAGQNGAEITTLREVIITGTRTEKPVLEAPVRTEVVNRKEIEKTHARDLKEALEDVPGLLLKPVHGKTGFEAWLQGLDSDRVLVVLDGEPITPSTGSSVDLSQIGTMGRAYRDSQGSHLGALRQQRHGWCHQHHKPPPVAATELSTESGWRQLWRQKPVGQRPRHQHPPPS